MKQFIMGVAVGIVVLFGVFHYKSFPPELMIKHAKSAPSWGEYLCWANPTKKAVKRCRLNKSCNGSGIYAWHPKEKKAKKSAVKACNKEYGKNSCELDYCEKLERKKK